MSNYNDTNTCDKIHKVGFSWRRCGKDFHGSALKEYDNNRKWTGNWICKQCYDKYDLNSWCKMRKSLRGRRTGYLNPSSPQEKGDKAQKLSCTWLGIEDLNIVNDNYMWPIDHSNHKLLGIIQTTSKWYDSYNQNWVFGNTIRDSHKDFDNMICYCISKDGKIIERIYIFPKEEIIKRSGISISKSPKDRWGGIKIPWYDKYRVKDEDVLKKVNDIWKKIIEN